MASVAGCAELRSQSLLSHLPGLLTFEQVLNGYDTEGAAGEARNC